MVETAATAPVGLPQARGDSLRVQLQFDRNGTHAEQVAAWFVAHYDHVACICGAQPGLTISLQVPDAAYDSFESWHARLIAATAPLDIALELVSECFDALGIEPADVVSMHVTDS